MSKTTYKYIYIYIYKNVYNHKSVFIKPALIKILKNSFFNIVKEDFTKVLDETRHQSLI